MIWLLNVNVDWSAPAWPLAPHLTPPSAAQIYNLPVTVVPPNRTVSRTDNPDVVFR